MFRDRNSSQKPNDEFISSFRTAFAGITPWRNSPIGCDETGGAMKTGSSVEDGEPDLEDSNKRTPRKLQDLDYAPSWTDINVMPMVPLAYQDPSLYTHNTVRTGAIWHQQAGDLHTPTIGLTTNTARSLSNTSLKGGIEDADQQYFAPQLFDMNRYAPQESCTPNAFMHRNIAIDSMDEAEDGSPFEEVPVDEASYTTSSTASLSVKMPHVKGEVFRFGAALHAPTAMVKHAQEVAISYLNKGQSFNLSITDSTPQIAQEGPIQYRTFVRVSFEDEEQRSRPAACWQLWKQGRGTSEIHQRGGKLLAVEYVGPLQSGGDDNQCQMQVEQVSFDGFCVTWTANPATGASYCTIPVRFNFLSTDFSRSKGVAGITVRLCTKTELVPLAEEGSASQEAEVCYCKVKLFRDHGAERKMSNDVAHVKKTIEKLKQQIAQADISGGFGKRKCGRNITVKSNACQSKIRKHNHTWPVTSQDEQPEKRLEDNVQANLIMMQMMLSSMRKVSILGLRGEEGDDPDLYPVRLLPDDNLVKIETLQCQNISSNISKLPSLGPSQAEEMRSTAVQRKLSNNSRESTGFIEAVGIDVTFRPPAKRACQPVACFYVRFAGKDQHPRYYYAIYLTERTVRDLRKKISEKQQIDTSSIVRILHVNEKGLRIEVDDDVVRELPEGQDMIAHMDEMTGSDGALGSRMEIKLKY
ncbi:hypothetical protein N7513_003565 [Penicillium frequentans]|nr:hypothetical protein N7513_003565 [Penicillium glabrum]